MERPQKPQLEHIAVEEQQGVVTIKLTEESEKVWADYLRAEHLYRQAAYKAIHGENAV